MPRLTWPVADLNRFGASDFMASATQKIEELASSFRQPPAQPQSSFLDSAMQPASPAPPAPESSPISFSLKDWSPWREQQSGGAEIAASEPQAGQTPLSFALEDWSPWRPKPTPSVTPAAMPTAPGLTPATITSGPRPGQTLQPGESVGSMTLGDGQSAGGEIDNSSRESFVRTAWPYVLRAAGGDANLAEMMLAKAISENGDIGKGGGIIGWNVSGIKGEGDAGSFEADTWEDYGQGRVNIRDKFAAYSGPEAGFGAFMKFLQDNSRYHPALAEYQKTGNAEKLFDDVNAAGYATDKIWSQKLRSIRDTQVRPVVRQTADARQSSMNADAVSPTAASAPAPAPAGSPPPASGGLPPTLAQAFKSANGRDPSPQEADELRQAFGMMA